MRMQTEDASLNKAGWLTIALIPLAAGVYALLEARPWQTEEATTGCVSGYERVVHPNAHNVVDTYFRVGRSDFHLNSGAWTPGFKDDASIYDGEKVVVRHRGAHIVDVQTRAGAC